MSLAFFKQQINDVDGEPRRLRQRDAIERRSTGRRLSDPRRGRRANRDDMCDGRFTVEDGDGSAAHGAKILTH